MRILLVVYDTETFIHTFSHASAAIGAILLKHGHEVIIYNQAVNHYPESHLHRYLDKNRFDVVGLSFIAGYYEYRKVLKISEAINSSKHRPFYIIGGHGPSPEPEFFLKKTGADVVVIGEGEETVIELLDVLEDKGSLHDVKGIAFMENGRCFINERRPLIKNIDKLPFPAYQLFPMEYYRLNRFPHYRNNKFAIGMLSGRGCVFKCSFCYRLDKGFRPRSNESIIEEIKLLKSDYLITNISFNDELLMSSCERTISLCNDFIKHKLNIRWVCNGRLNYAKKEVLDIMNKAGCTFINYGIESMDDQILRNMNKVLTTKEIIEGVEATIEAGITPGLNIIFGNIGENREILRKGVDFLLKYGDGVFLRTIRPVTPYPGSELYYYAIKKGLLKDAEDFYENKHINSDLLAVNFTELSDAEFYDALYEANSILIDDFLKKQHALYISQLKNLYYKRDSSFRGFRQT